MIERLTSELKLTDEEANSVVTIQQDYQLKARSIKVDSQTSDKEKQEKLEPPEEEKTKKLRKIINEEQVIKVEEIIKDLMKDSQQNRTDQLKIIKSNCSKYLRSIKKGSMICVLFS